MTRGIVRKAKSDVEFEAAVANELMLARRVHAGNRNVNRVKVSVATTPHRSKSGQFVTHIQALPERPMTDIRSNRHPCRRGPGWRNADPHHRRCRL
ncbi:hypothetical protein [Rhizobium sp. TRM95796]|uniref:hypothetical protein n=1 Tax=Rhizobium sp. TRM95796 TaxID=2979862 RepID=UPI0021E87DBA|nr:hypothetical protein [Rhizobium sp. TRM95796]MCV3768066.1 hypothetical protein [Rhizobium sp. TRM95796]